MTSKPPESTNIAEERTEKLTEDEKALVDYSLAVIERNYDFGNDLSVQKKYGAQQTILNLGNKVLPYLVERYKEKDLATLGGYGLAEYMLQLATPSDLPPVFDAYEHVLAHPNQREPQGQWDQLLCLLISGCREQHTDGGREMLELIAERLLHLRNIPNISEYRIQKIDENIANTGTALARQHLEKIQASDYVPYLVTDGDYSRDEYFTDLFALLYTPKTARYTYNFTTPAEYMERRQTPENVSWETPRNREGVWWQEKEETHNECVEEHPSLLLNLNLENVQRPKLRLVFDNRPLERPEPEQPTDPTLPKKPRVELEREDAETTAYATVQLINKVLDDETDVLFFLDKSARPAALMFLDTWKRVLPDKTPPEIRFLNIGREGVPDPDNTYYETDKIANPDARDAQQYKGKNLCVVDEWSDTGFTVERAKNYAARAFPQAIKVSAVTMFPSLPFWATEQGKPGNGVIDPEEALLTYNTQTRRLERLTLGGPSVRSTTLELALAKPEVRSRLQPEELEELEAELAFSRKRASKLRYDLNLLAEETAKHITVVVH